MPASLPLPAEITALTQNQLTGELEYILPHMIAILVAKWTADAISKEGVYDLAQTVLGHPFLDNDHALELVQAYGTSPKHSASFSVANETDANPALVEVLIPPARTMQEITVEVPPSNTVPKALLEQKLDQLHARGLMDAGLVLVQHGMLQGYLAGKRSLFPFPSRFFPQLLTNVAQHQRLSWNTVCGSWERPWQKAGRFGCWAIRLKAAITRKRGLKMGAADGRTTPLT